MSLDWPMEMLSVFTFEELDDRRTKLAVTFTPLNASDDEIAVFDNNHPSMTQGFGGSFEKLDAYLAKLQKR